ncbi:MAG: hypothetical protein WCE62_20235, partial [Polyangiales bacterium]
MATDADDRLSNTILLATLATSAFFCAQGVTALLAAKVLPVETDAPPAPSRSAIAQARTERKRDPSIILRRNIFDSALGDLSEVPIDEPALPQEDMPLDEVETSCKSNLRLIATVVIPGDLERSLAAIVGTDQKAGLHRGGAEVEG